MLVVGELENVPLLDVLQVVSHAKQSGVLSVKGGSIQGSVIFEEGDLVCAESTSSRMLLQRAASESEVQTRAALRRIGALAALTELLALRGGAFRFRRVEGRVEDLAGVKMGVFYEAGPMDTGELLLVLTTAIDKKEDPHAAPPGPKADVQETEHETQRSHPRFSPTLIPAVISHGARNLNGHLTNVSEGGGFFHGLELPEEGAACRVRFSLPGAYGTVETAARVAWVRTGGVTAQRGVGLSFQEMSDDARGRLRSYLEHYERLADEYRTGEGSSSEAATPGNLRR